MARITEELKDEMMRVDEHDTLWQHNTKNVFFSTSILLIPNINSE